MNFHALTLFFAGWLGWAPEWVIAVAVGGCIVIAGLALQWIVLWLVGMVSKRWDPLLQFIFLRTRRLFRFAIVLLAVDVALPLLPLAHDVLDMMRAVMLALFIILIGYTVYMGVDIAITRYLNSLRMDAQDNLLARKAATQMRVLRRTINILIIFITLGFALMSFNSVRQFGVSLFASAGVAGLAVGIAARPLLSNLIAGMQLALAQPIRLDDVVVIAGEWGRIEEFTSTYVVVRIWDLRRLIVPLSYFLENPFANWTYSNSQLLGTVYLYMDYAIPVTRLREKAIELIKKHPNWDGQVAGLQITDAKEHTLEIRVLMSAADASKSFDLRCAIREKLIDFIQREYPHALPRTRADLSSLEEREEARRANFSSRAAATDPSHVEGAEGSGHGASIPGISRPTPMPDESGAGEDPAPDPERPPPLPDPAQDKGLLKR